MAYTKTVYVNDNPPALNADNLNHIEQGIYDAHQENEELSYYISTINKEKVSYSKAFI